MKRLATYFMAAGLAVAAAATQIGCTPAKVSLRAEPPAPRYEVVDHRPGHVWARGHWMRTDDGWAWRSGYFVPVRPGYVFQQGHWARHDGHYYWVPGTWRARRDDARWVRGHYVRHGDRHVWVRGRFEARASNDDTRGN